MRGLSLVVASGGHSSSRCTGLSLSRPLLLRSTGSRCAGSVIVAHGPVAPRHVGSSQTRARTCVPCIGRQILNHCATRGVLSLSLNFDILIIMCQCGSLWVHLLEFSRLPRSGCPFPCPVRHVFSHYIFRQDFCSFFSLFSFWDPYNVNVSLFDVVP